MSNVTIQEQKNSITVQVTQNGVIVTEKPNKLVISEAPKNTLEVKSTENKINIQSVAHRTLELKGGIQGPKGDQGDAGTVIEAIAGENISALKIVRALNATDVLKSESNSTFANAKCLGITLTGATSGNNIRIQFFGAVGDASFNFPVNAPLYLTTDGNITDDASLLTVYNTTIGYSLGAGAIFIDLQEPIAL